MPQGRRAFACKGLFDARGPCPIRWLQAIQQAIGTAIQELGKTGKGCDRKREITVFYGPNGLHMHIGQFRQTLLRQASLEPGFSHVASDQSQDFTVVHC